MPYGFAFASSSSCAPVAKPAAFATQNLGAFMRPLKYAYPRNGSRVAELPRKSRPSAAAPAQMPSVSTFDSVASTTACACRALSGLAGFIRGASIRGA